MGITVTDGTNTVTGATQIDFVNGLKVSGTTPNAVVTNTYVAPNSGSPIFGNPGVGFYAATVKGSYNSATSGYISGGSANLYGGNGKLSGGYVNVKGGNGTGAYNYGGGIRVIAGNAGYGGFVHIYAGTSTYGNHLGGKLRIKGGQGPRGGPTSIFGGYGTSNVGGDLSLYGGAGTGHKGGNVFIGGGGGSSRGNVFLKNLPTSDPGISGAVFSLAGVLHVSP